MAETKVYNNSSWEMVGANNVLNGTLVSSSASAGTSVDVYKISSVESGTYLVDGQVRMPFSSSHNQIAPQIQLRAGTDTIAYQSFPVPSGSDTLVLHLTTVMQNPSSISVGVYAPVAVSGMSGYVKAVKIG